MALMVLAQRIDDILTQAWAPVVDLHLAFESWNLNRTEVDIKQVLNSRKKSISELERIAIEARGVEEVNWHFALLTDMNTGETHKCLCVSSLLKRASHVLIIQAIGLVSRDLIAFHRIGRSCERSASYNSIDFLTHRISA
jgi:hypothetical protein